MSRFRLMAAIGLIASITSCGGVLQGLQTSSLHQRYADGLTRAGLAETSLVRRWHAASEHAISNPIVVSLPYRESTYVPSNEVLAAGYRVSLRLGQRLVARIERDESDSLAVFADLFETGPGGADRVASAAADGTLEYEPVRDGDVVLRVQPELLSSGRFVVSLVAEPTLAFPVAGHGSRSVGGTFGDPRDAGARDHHGIDIFARHGTPVVAATGGVVGSTEENVLGGIVVWLHDRDRKQSLYYAHLDRRLVSVGQHVDQGDTLGLVGTTGNARGSSPHLHFGIYRSGPVDPLPFVRPSDEPPPVTAPGALLGRWARVRVRSVPATGGTTPQALARNAVVRVDGAAQGVFRVRLPDERPLFVHAGALESMEGSVDRIHLARRTIASERPHAGSAVVDTLEPGVPIAVFGRFGEFRFVKLDGGRMGWIRG